MEIEKGYKIDSPDIFVPWGIGEDDFIELFKETSLIKVTEGYFSLPCDSIGMNCYVGFHFNPRVNGSLRELEFFRKDYTDLKKSFEDFQQHFEKTFGRPTNRSKGSEGFDNVQWSINGITIIHYVYDRFGLEEHMRIQCVTLLQSKRIQKVSLWSRIKKLWS